MFLSTQHKEEIAANQFQSFAFTLFENRQNYFQKVDFRRTL